MDTMKIKMLTNFKADKYGFLEVGRIYEVYSKDAEPMIKNKRATEELYGKPELHIDAQLKKGASWFNNILTRRLRLKKQLLEYVTNKKEKGSSPAIQVSQEQESMVENNNSVPEKKKKVGPALQVLSEFRQHSLSQKKKRKKYLHWKTKQKMDKNETSDLISLEKGA